VEEENKPPPRIKCNEYPESLHPLVRGSTHQDEDISPYIPRGWHYKPFQNPQNEAKSLNPRECARGPSKETPTTKNNIKALAQIKRRQIHGKE